MEVVLLYGHAQLGAVVLMALKTEPAQTQDVIEFMENLPKLKIVLAVKTGFVDLGLNVH